MGPNDENEFQDVCLRTIIKKNLSKILNMYLQIEQNFTWNKCLRVKASV